MASANLEQLDPWDPKNGTLIAVIETPKGNRNKFCYEGEKGFFRLKTVLPLGESFPYDFGFIPSTLCDDGDPLDVLILMDEPAFAGCVVPIRLIGVIEAEQTEDGKTVSNDRVIAVADECHLFQNVSSLKELPPHLVDEIEHFFVSYNDLKAKQFKPIGRHGPKRAGKVVKKAVEQCSSRGAVTSPTGNGQTHTQKRPARAGKRFASSGSSFKKRNPA